MKVRLDNLLIDKGLAASRTQAAGLIMAGEVTVDGRRVDKPGAQVDPAADLRLASRPRYVSRGGDKLASVAAEFGLDLNGKTVLDVGASTGGFTDFVLQHGAGKVVCVDVGTGQLAWQLRQDDRVEVHEQTDIRKFETDARFDIILADVSFISLAKVLPSASHFLAEDGVIVAMAKPQFEAGKALADRFKGVIVEPERSQVLADFEAAIADQFDTLAKADSGLAGAEGNLERFYLLKPKR